MRSRMLAALVMALLVVGCAKEVVANRPDEDATNGAATETNRDGVPDDPADGAAGGTAADPESGGTEGEDPTGSASTDAGDGTTAGSSDGDQRGGGGAQAPAAAREALGISGRTLDGGHLDVVSFAGDPVALWMWAPW
jgi:hypothetical protein